MPPPPPQAYWPSNLFCLQKKSFFHPKWLSLYSVTLNVFEKKKNNNKIMRGIHNSFSRPNLKNLIVVIVINQKTGIKFENLNVLLPYHSIC